jgi:hypothetical protein
MSMLGSPNLHRGNVPLAMRLKIHDLQAQLAPLERYGVGGISFAITSGIRARCWRRVARRLFLRRRYWPQCRGRLIARLVSSI